MPARPQTPRLPRAAAGAQPPASRAGHASHPGAAAGDLSRLGRRGTHHSSRAPLRTAPGLGPRFSGCAAARPRRRARLPAGERGFGAEPRGGGPAEGPMVGRRARAGQPITPGGRPSPALPPAPSAGFLTLSSPRPESGWLADPGAPVRARSPASGCGVQTSQRPALGASGARGEARLCPANSVGSLSDLCLLLGACTGV